MAYDKVELARSLQMYNRSLFQFAKKSDQFLSGYKMEGIDKQQAVEVLKKLIISEFAEFSKMARQAERVLSLCGKSREKAVDYCRRCISSEYNVFGHDTSLYIFGLFLEEVVFIAYDNQDAYRPEKRVYVFLDVYELLKEFISMCSEIFEEMRTQILNILAGFTLDKNGEYAINFNERKYARQIRRRGSLPMFRKYLEYVYEDVNRVEKVPENENDLKISEPYSLHVALLLVALKKSNREGWMDRTKTVELAKYDDDQFCKPQH